MIKSTETKTAYIHKEIIEKCKEGDSAAQYKLYKLYSQAMYNVCYRIMNNREDAEDILQEAFTDAFLNLGSFRYESSFGTWLKRNVINKCLNEIARRKPELVFCDDLSYFHKDEDYNEEYAQGLTKDNIVTALETLPSGAKMVFSLYMLEGYDHEEIAQILNISVTGSRTQLMRAKRKVKEQLIVMKNKKECIQVGQADTPLLGAFIHSSFNQRTGLQAV